VGSIKRVGVVSSFLMFLIPGLLFWAHLNWTVPAISNLLQLSVYASWVVVGTFFLFLPLFLFTLYLLKRDNYRLDLLSILKRLRIKKMTRSDWLWTGLSLMTAIVIAGAIVILLLASPLNIDASALKEISPIETSRLVGTEQYFFLLLPVFFFFNYVGEEMLWRGYILPRQEVSFGKFAWIFNGVLHALFHLPFGLLIHIISIPIYLVVPFVVYKTKNTTTAIIIHALLGAPMQILVALGIIS